MSEFSGQIEFEYSATYDINRDISFNEGFIIIDPDFFPHIVNLYTSDRFEINLDLIIYKISSSGFYNDYNIEPRHLHLLAVSEKYLLIEFADKELLYNWREDTVYPYNAPNVIDDAPSYFFGIVSDNLYIATLRNDLSLIVEYNILSSTWVIRRESDIFPVNPRIIRDSNSNILLVYTTHDLAQTHLTTIEHLYTGEQLTILKGYNTVPVVPDHDIYMFNSMLYYRDGFYLYTLPFETRGIEVNDYSKPHYAFVSDGVIHLLQFADNSDDVYHFTADTRPLTSRAKSARK